MLKIAIDSYYEGDQDCYTVGVIFKEWTDREPEKIVSCHTKNFSPYIPGQFYKRELPGILELLSQVKLEEYDAIILDSYIDLVDKETGEIIEGLGRHLINSLIENKKLHPGLNIIGVAKSKFGKTGKISEAVLRGKSKKPLWIQSLRSVKEVRNNIQGMFGENRLPSMLKTLDNSTKGR